MDAFTPCLTEFFCVAKILIQLIIKEVRKCAYKTQQTKKNRPSLTIVAQLSVEVHSMLNHIMKKFWSLMVVALVTLGAGFTSCSDDDDPRVLLQQ